MLNETAMCMADSCTEANDVANCCIDLAKCDSYKCEICDKRVIDEYCADINCTISDYDTCCTRIFPELDDSKGVIVEWNVALGGDVSVSDHETITDTIADYLDLPCIWINGSYTSSGSNWDAVYEIFVSTDGNDDAWTELETDIYEVSTIDGLKTEIASNLGVSSISFSTISLSSESHPSSGSSTSGSSTVGLSIGIGVGVAVVLIIVVVVVWYKHNQGQKRGTREKVSDVFEM